MRWGSVVLVASIVTAGAAVAAATADQDGECRYTGDWQTQLTPLTDGPGREQYADVGACASVAIEKVAAHRWRFALRAESNEASSTDYVVEYGHEEDSGWATRADFTCTHGACVLGPLDGEYFDALASASCLYAEIWKDGVKHRSARACA